MRKNHIRWLYVASGAILALWLVPAPALANNNPEFFYCFKEAGGKYEDAACSTEGAKKEFSRKAPGVGEIAYNAIGSPRIITPFHEFSCTSVETTGETDGALVIQNVTMTFKGCSDTATGKSCGTGAGHEIVTNPLFGELYYLKKGHAPPAGFVLGPKVGTLWAAFQCGEREYQLLGQVIGKVETTEKAVAANDVIFKENVLTEQEFTQIEETPALGKYELKVGVYISGILEGEEQAVLVNTETQKWPCPNMGVATK